MADSDHFSRAGIVAALASAGDIFIENVASTVAETVHLAIKHRPDVVLIEASLSGGNPLAAISDIVDAVPTMKVAVLASRRSQEQVTQAYFAGSVGIISKSSISTDLSSAVRMIAGGYLLFAQPHDGWVYPAKVEKQVESQAIVQELGDRDRRLVSLVAAGLTNSQISRVIHLSEGSVKLHLARLMDELSVNNRVQMAVIAAESGLVTSADLPIAG